MEWVAVMNVFREAGYRGVFNLEVPGETVNFSIIEREQRLKNFLKRASLLLSPAP